MFFFLDALVFDQKVKDLIFNNMPRDLIIAFGKKKKPLTFDKLPNNFPDRATEKLNY